VESSVSGPTSSENHLLAEILEQPAVLRRLIEHYVTAQDSALSDAANVIRRADRTIFAGMVTSEYAGYSASAYLSQHARTSNVFDASELLYYHLPALYQPGTCLVLVSQSGNSAEIVRLLDQVRGRVPIVGIYNDETSSLAQGCDIGLPILAGPQLACGTKTNAASIAVLQLLAEEVVDGTVQTAGGALSGAADAVSQFLGSWETIVTPVVDLLQPSTYTVFLGRGPGHASAMFSAAVFREVPKAVADGMSAATFRHGMWEMIRPEHRAVIFAPDGPAIKHLSALAKDLLRLHVPAIVVTSSRERFEGSAVLQVPAVPERWSSLVDMVPLQLTSYLLARRRGVEPGRLVISSYVTRVE
jgi:glucosamine--fructose-6-phosphate aminotransferase (isomerizing)